MLKPSTTISEQNQQTRVPPK